MSELVEARPQRGNFDVELHLDSASSSRHNFAAHRIPYGSRAGLPGWEICRAQIYASSIDTPKRCCFVRLFLLIVLIQWTSRAFSWLLSVTSCHGT